MRPLDLFPNQFSRGLRIKDERRFARRARSAIAAKLQTEKSAFERMNSFDADAAF
jgi:hypothetical protein